MPDYTVTTAFKGQDGTSATLSKMRGNVKSFSKVSKAEFKSIGTVFKGTFAANMMSRGITSMLGLARRGLGTVVEEYVDFDSQIGQAAAKFPDHIKRGTDEFDNLATAARKIGAETEFTAAQAASGLAEYAKAGIDANTAIGLLAGTAELATNAEVEFAAAASLSLNALDAFNLRSKDAAETAANLASVNDTLTAVVTSAKLDFEDFGETLKHTGPVAAAVGASFSDMAAATGLVAKAGITGSLAGTTLKNIYLGLAAATPQAQKTLEDLGVQVVDPLTGDLRDMLDVLVDFSAATEDMGNAQRLAAINTVFGKRAVSGVSKIMSLGSDEIKEYRDQLNDSKDASKDMAVEIRQSLGNKLKTLQSSLIEVGFKFIEAFAGEGPEALDELVKSINEYDVKPLIKEVERLIDVGKTMFRLVRDNWDTVKTLAKAFVAVKIAVSAVKFAQWGMGLASMMKPLGAAINQTAALGGNLNKINATTGGTGGALYTPAAKGAAPVKGGAGTGVGKAGAAMGAISAVVVGWTVGTAISTKLEDVGQGIASQQASSQNMINKFTDQLSGFGGKKMGVDEAKIAIDAMAKSLNASKEAANSWTTPFTTIAAVFVGAKTPLEDYLEKQKQIDALYAKMSVQLGLTAEDIRLLGEAALAGRSVANVNVNVEGSGAGAVTTTTSTSGPAAPKVDVKKSGQAA